MVKYVRIFIFTTNYLCNLKNNNLDLYLGYSLLSGLLYQFAKFGNEEYCFLLEIGGVSRFEYHAQIRNA